MAAALIALLAALCLASSTVCQHRAAADSAAATGVGVGLVWRLTRSPLWLMGLLAGAAGLALQALALSRGQLVVVQPVLVTGMLFAIPASVLLERRRPQLREWLYALAVVVGLVVFLLSSRPTRGQPVAAAGLLGLCTGGSVAVLVVAAGLAFGLPRRHRARLLGVAAGVAFGLTSVLLKQVVGQLAESPGRVLSGWPPYVCALVGLAGVVLAQVSYQAGPLSASQPGLTIAEPLVAVLVGRAAFDEVLVTGTPDRVGQLCGAALLSWALVRLTALPADGAPSAPDRTDDLADV